MTAPTRPILRYHGGKWRLAPWIIEHFPAHRVYVEPFGGAGSVLLRKARASREIMNDLDGEVVNVFRVLRDPESAREMERLLRLTPFAREEFVAAHDRTAEPLENARRTIIRSFFGFAAGSLHAPSIGSRGNGGPGGTGFRTKNGGNGGSPARDWRNYSAAIPTFTARLMGVVIEQRDAVAVIAAHDAPDAMIYADPPYPMRVRDDNRPDYAHELTDDDHRRLAETLHAASGMVVVSGYACDLYDADLYRDWRRVERAARADGGLARTEVLWLNPRCSEALATLPLGGAA